MKFNNFKSAFLLSIFFLFPSTINAEKSSKYKINEISLNKNQLIYEKNQTIGNEYLIGPGDVLIQTVLGLPELSGEFGIGPDGMIYLPQIEGIFVNLMSLDEFKAVVINKYERILNDPNISIQIGKIRPVRVFVKGEVKIPGFYNLGLDSQNYTINSLEKQSTENTEQGNLQSLSMNNLLFPTVYDALKIAGGITTYSDLSSINVVRQSSYTNGGGKIKTELDFLSLFTEGDQSQNIRLFDGDTIIVSKSDKSLKEQLIEVNASNLNPAIINVFVSGKVNSPGSQSLPTGSGLNQAIAFSGGRQLVSGKIEFVRFIKNGEVDRRVFSYNQKATLDSHTNPILEDGDIINIRDSLFGKTTEVLNKVLQPVTPILFIKTLID